MALCDEEQEYLEKRKELVYTSMQKLLGNRAPSDITQVSVDNYNLCYYFD